MPYFWSDDSTENKHYEWLRKMAFLGVWGYEQLSPEDNNGPILLQNYIPTFLKLCSTQWSLNYAYMFDGL